jgi:uncharacterized radical SAM superfamily Fe-S cluster-containing enzyme
VEFEFGSFNYNKENEALLVSFELGELGEAKDKKRLSEKEISFNNLCGIALKICFELGSTSIYHEGKEWKPTFDKINKIYFQVISQKSEHVLAYIYRKITSKLIIRNLATPVTKKLIKKPIYFE